MPHRASYIYRPPVNFLHPVDFGAVLPRPLHLPRVTPSEVETAVRSLRPLCVRWARSVVGGDAEDVAQAALEALVRKGPLIEAGAATAWLRTAVYYLARSHMRGRKELLVTGPELAADGDPEDTLASAQLSAEVQALLGGITSPLGAVVGGVLMGVIENLAGAYVVGTELKLTTALVIIVVVLVVKPTGLFGKSLASRV